MAVNLGSIYSSIDLKLDTFNTNINKAVGKFKELGTSVNDVNKNGMGKLGGTLQDVGGKFNSFGNKMTLGVTTPIVGAGVAATKFGMDFERGMAKIGSIADTTKVPIEELQKGIVNLSNKTGQSTADLNEALYQAISASVDTAHAVDFLDIAVKASVGGFTDTTTAVDGLTTVLNSYGLEATEAEKIANQMLVTQNKGKTTFGELATAVGKVTPVASALNMKTEELFSSLAVTTAQGLSTAESVTGLKAALSNIIKPSKEALDASEALGIEFSVSALQSKGWIGFLRDLKQDLNQACPEFEALSNKVDNNSKKMVELSLAGKENSKEFKDLLKLNKSFRKELEMLGEMADSPVSAMAKMFGSVEGLNGILMLTSETGFSKYNEAMEEMNSNTTALDDAYKKMSETTEFKFNKAMTNAKNTMMEFGLKILPTVEKGLELFSTVLDKFNSLSPSMQDNIIKFAMMSAAVGPVAKGIGGVTSAVGGLLKTGSNIGKFFGFFKGGATVATTATKALGTTAAVAGGASGMGALATSIGGAIATFAPWIAGAAAVGAGAYGIYKVVSSDAVPAVDMFADKMVTTTDKINGTGEIVGTEMLKISEATKTAVQGYLDFRESSLATLNEWATGVTAVTDENIANWIQKNTEYTETLKNQNETNRTEELVKATEFYSNMSLLDDEAKQQLIDQNDNYYTQLNEHIDGATKAQNEIIQKVKNGEITLTNETIQELLRLENHKSDKAIEILSTEEKEIAILQARMKENSIRESNEQASSIIKKANETRDNKIKAAEEEFNGVITFLEEQKLKGINISEEQYNAIVESARNRKEETIDLADEEKRNVVSKLEEMGIDLKHNIDTDTGEMLSKWDSFWSKVGGKFTKGGNDANTELGASMRNMDSTADSGMNSIEKSVGNSVTNINKDISTIGTGINNLPSNKTISIHVNKHLKEFSDPTARNNAGTFDWRGGRTIVNDTKTIGTGEVMDLPSGTRIYPGDVSMRMAQETAKETAKEIVSQLKLTNEEGSGLTLNIKEFVNNRVQDVEELAQELAFYIKNNNLSLGRG